MRCVNCSFGNLRVALNMWSKCCSKISLSASLLGLYSSCECVWFLLITSSGPREARSHVTSTALVHLSLIVSINSRKSTYSSEMKMIKCKWKMKPLAQHTFGSSAWVWPIHFYIWKVPAVVLQRLTCSQEHFLCMNQYWSRCRSNI